MWEPPAASAHPRGVGSLEISQLRTFRTLERICHPAHKSHPVLASSPGISEPGEEGECIQRKSWRELCHLSSWGDTSAGQGSPRASFSLLSTGEGFKPSSFGMDTEREMIQRWDPRKAGGSLEGTEYPGCPRKEQQWGHRVLSWAVPAPGSGPCLCLSGFGAGGRRASGGGFIWAGEIWGKERGDSPGKERES